NQNNHVGRIVRQKTIAGLTLVKALLRRDAVIDVATDRMNPGYSSAGVGERSIGPRHPSDSAIRQHHLIFVFDAPVDAAHPSQMLRHTSASFLGDEVEKTLPHHFV